TQNEKKRHTDMNFDMNFDTNSLFDTTTDTFSDSNTMNFVTIFNVGYSLISKFESIRNT
ncbi:23630_t:CDS:1, partial [Dentiscutata erythropus]